MNMSQQQANHYAHLVSSGDGKIALDQMLEYGFSSKDIGDFYRRINFYPNAETIAYISKNVRHSETTTA